jgi:myo-inositol 2-dehydrogenase/D-chiro-inositol 1-dehydrogenase
VLTDPKIGTLGDYDSANVILRTPSGKQGTITNSRRAAYGYDQRIEVLGALGAVSADNTHLSNIQVATKAGFTRPPLLDFFMTRYERAYAAEIAAFIAALEGGTAMPVTGEDGMLALALAEAALRSVAEGRAVKVAEVLA